MVGIRNIYSVMHPSIGLTPERLTAILREAEAGDPFLYLELAEEMEEKDLHYLAVLSTRKQTVAQLGRLAGGSDRLRARHARRGSPATAARVVRPLLQPA